MQQRPGSPPQSGSPPRRARRLDVPATYLSPSFSAARQALNLISLSGEERQQTLSSLRTLHADIARNLQDSAPDWVDLVPAVNTLSASLNTTQSATKLRETLTTLSKPSRDDYSARMDAVVRTNSQLASTVLLASKVREFAQMLSTVDSAIPSVEGITSHRSPASSHAFFRAQPPSAIPSNFLACATSLHKARTAAHSQPLSLVPALDNARDSLDRRHLTLLSDLETSLINGIYAGVFPSSKGRKRNVGDTEFELADSFADMATPLKIMSPSIEPSTSVGSASTCVDMARAIDLLHERGRAAKILKEACHKRIVTLVREAVLSESPIPARTVASLASSSFTAAPTNTPNFSVNSTTTGSLRGMTTVFGKDVAHSDRVSCAAAFERVRFQVTGVLRRLSALADGVGEELKDIPNAISSIWKITESVLAIFIQVLLGFPAVDDHSDGSAEEARDEPGRGISLLPAGSRRNPDRKISDHPYAWELKRGRSPLDSFVTLVNSMPTLTPSIYNLEVVYSPLQQFIMNSSRLQESWEDKSALHESHEGRPGSLPALLNRTVHHFVSCVREDVKHYMETAFGNRAGTLLQPFLGRQSGSHSGSVSSSSLPPLPQTQMLIDVIASCLSLAVAVPRVAGSLGEIINEQVILPFSSRAVYALRLAASWTDAGPLVDEMQKAARTAERPRVNWADAVEKPVRGKGRNGLKALKNAEMLKTIRKNPELSTQCLANISDTLLHGNPVKISMLDESEWNAVVRLVSNTKVVISQLENCVSKKSIDHIPQDVRVSSFRGAPDVNRPASLRGMLEGRGISSRLHGTILEAVEKTEEGCRVLREDVIEQGILLLHAEVALKCFSAVVHTLGDDYAKANVHPEEGGSMTSVQDLRAEDDTNGRGLTRPSSIFKISKLQLDAVDQESNNFGHAMNEFDEFGDRIIAANEAVTDAEMEEYGFPNSLLLEQGDWKLNESSGEKGQVSLFSNKKQQAMTKADEKVMDRGRAFGESLKHRDECLCSNLSESDRNFIFSQADASVALGIRASGRLRVRGDKDVASGARVFLDATSTIAAETIGWPVVENDYSVVEGASQSASECRTLLYGSGLL